MGDVSTPIWRFLGPACVGLAALAIIFALGYGFSELNNYAKPVIGGSLPVIAVGGVIILVLLLTAVTMIFSVLGLANKEQPLGLPEGSVRAVIALSLIVLFTILSVFLYKSVSGDSAKEPVNIIENLSEAERAQFMRDHITARDIASVQRKDENGKSIDRYNITYRSTNPASDDFAKQLLVLLGTLMTAVTSFYLGAGTVTSAVNAAQAKTETEALPPKLIGIKPTSHSITKDGPVIHLEVTGSNLNAMTHIRIARGTANAAGTNVRSNGTSVVCDIPVNADTTPPGAPWDVIVDDGGSKSVSLSGVLTIAA